MITRSLVAFPALIVLLLALLQWLMPRLTRRDLWFAVTVAPSFPDTAEARATERRYQLTILLVALLALGLSVATAGHLLATPIGVITQILGGTLAFLQARGRTLPHAVPTSAVREATLSRPHTRLPPALQLGPFMILGAAVLWLRSIWATLPERIPLHWNLQGEVDRWADKTVGEVFAPMVSGVALCAAIWLMGRVLARGRRVSASGPAAAGEETFRRRMLGVLLAVEYLVAITFALVAVAMAGGPLWPALLAPVLSLALVIVLIVVTVRTGQGGSRLAPAGGFGDRTADAHWKWGLVYFNREDPAVFVEKRFGVGYTINFARPAAWGFIALIVLLPVGVRLVAQVAR